MILGGRAVKIGDHVSTDQILPGRYMSLTDAEELGRHALEGLDPEFSSRISPGDILVAGVNFGTGSSREQAPQALRAAGFPAILAASFARIFFRNCINIGLPVLWSPQASEGISDGDLLKIDTTTGAILDETNGASFDTSPMPGFVASITEMGGLIPYALSRSGKRLFETEGERTG